MPRKTTRSSKSSARKSPGRVEKVNRVLDGDTFKTAHKGRKNSVRLANVNAPEKGQRGAAAAQKKLATLTKGKNVKIETVGRSYGRAVAKVTANGKSVNAAMNKFLKGK